DLIGWLLVDRHALELLIRVGKGRCAGVLGVPQMPDHATTDNGRQVHFVCPTAAMLLISEEIDRQRQSTPGEHGHQTVLSKCADQAIERHGWDMLDDRAEFQTEPTMRRQQSVTGHFRTHLAITQDEMWEDRE